VALDLARDPRIAMPRLRAQERDRRVLGGVPARAELAVPVARSARVRFAGTFQYTTW
jgi:hypothetical protein